MNRNPAIHRRPSGDIDIALAEPDPAATGSGVARTASVGAGAAGAGLAGVIETGGDLVDGAVTAGPGGP
ncbi:hypothetical protein [Frankia sp. R82]|uniref:hypothetical protein n=1 Tax=Frankia sp. R82 TaxID=2950553 RepID=UPI0020449A24|nr:hypothetical protein [Frankia sp. R82]MCM3886686.1 hypothetical protein [Frankia sp. R82]